MTHQPIIRAALLPGELVVDNFAGGGGASLGIEQALGRPCDIAINHDPVAIAMHRANHPETKHFVEDIHAVDPREACGGRPVGLAWFSPDCKHFSRAKGGKPVNKKIRGLAWVVVRWAKRVRPRLIILENVQEFEGWGPLRKDGLPDRRRVGATFREWLGKLRGCGYTVEFRTLVAADYGTPTTRRRLFLIARRDDATPVWPEPTHGSGCPEAWRPASEIIDWALPCPSIFERRRPLADATMRRIAEGIRRFVIETDAPFILTNTTGHAPREIGQPLPTVTTGNHRYLVSPTLIQTSYGERPGQSPRVPGLHKPLGTVVAGGAKHALVATFMAQHFGNSKGRPMQQPVGTVTAGGQGHQALVAAMLTKHYGGVVGHGVERPIGTITAQDHHSLTCAFLSKYYGTSIGQQLDRPLPTVTTGGGRGGGHLAEVRAFMVKYYSSGGQHNSLHTPLGAVTGKARFGLVTVHGQPYQIIDIGMRMLQPHELFAAQGFPGRYEIRPDYNGKPLTKTAQISLAGNAVCPQVAEALVLANAAA